MYSGVSTASLFLREYNEDALALLDGLGVRSTEIFLTTFSEYTEEFARLLLSRRGNLEVNSVHLLNTQFEPQLFGAHPRAREDAFRILDGAMASAHIFGAKKLYLSRHYAPEKKFRAARFCKNGQELLRDRGALRRARGQTLPRKRALGLL